MRRSGPSPSIVYKSRNIIRRSRDTTCNAALRRFKEIFPQEKGEEWVANVARRIDLREGGIWFTG